MKLSLVLLVALCATAMAGTTTTAETTTAETTTELTTTELTTTAEATTTAEETTTGEATTELPCSYDKSIGSKVGMNVFDAKLEWKKLDKFKNPENDRDFGLNCGKGAKTDTNDVSLWWVAPNSGLVSFDTEGNADTYVQVVDTKNCKGKTIACNEKGVAVQVEKGVAYGIVIHGQEGGNRGKFQLNIRKNCEYPYPSDAQCEAHCAAKSEIDIYKKCRVYYSRVVENDNHCPRCRCSGVNVPMCVKQTTTKKPTTKKVKKTTTKKDKKDKKTTKKAKETTKKAKETTKAAKDSRRRRRRRRD